MDSQELSIILLNITIILVVYLFLYPKLAGNNIDKIGFYDFFASGFSLLLVGLKYWDSGYEFNLLITKVNWFWFTVVAYFAMELPILIWYIKKHKVKMLK